jgi:hypothetical protein
MLFSMQMESGKTKTSLLICLAFTIFMVFCKTSTVSSSKQSPCTIDSRLWLSDVCGSNGYKKKVASCLILKSADTPVFKKESDALFYLGKPDTIFFNVDMTKRYFYVIDGSPTCMLFFPDGILESLSIYIDKNKKIFSITGAIH